MRRGGVHQKSHPNLREQMADSTEGRGVGKTKKMTNKNIPSNEKAAQNKEKVDELINKLDRVKVNRKNIIFDI